MGTDILNIIFHQVKKKKKHLTVVFTWPNSTNFLLSISIPSPHPRVSATLRFHFLRHRAPGFCLEHLDRYDEWPSILGQTRRQTDRESCAPARRAMSVLADQLSVKARSLRDVWEFASRDWKRGQRKGREKEESRDLGMGTSRVGRWSSRESKGPSLPPGWVAYYEICSKSLTIRHRVFSQYHQLIRLLLQFLDRNSSIPSNTYTVHVDTFTLDAIIVTIIRNLSLSLSQYVYVYVKSNTGYMCVWERLHECDDISVI